MEKIYVPEDTTFNKCYVVQSSGIIRGYNKVPANGVEYSYRDYYIDSNYIYKDGTGNWSQYSTLPICLASDVITNDYYYRNDFSDILIMFSIIAIFGIYFPFKILFRLFRRFN